MALKFDVGEIPRKQSFGSIHTTIGELKIFSISIGGMIALKKDLGKPIKECEPTDFIRHFICYVCFPLNSLKEGGYPSSNSKLSLEDISMLTENELDKIAEIFINGNEYLFKKYTFKEKLSDEAKPVFVAELNDIKYQKNENENFIKYLLRLFINEEEERKNSLEKAYAGINSFSKTLSEEIKNTLKLGEGIKESFNSNLFIPDNFREPIIPKMPEIHLTKQDHLFVEISSILDKLVKESIQSKNFLVKSNEIQTKIAAEINASGKKNVNLTWLVILISVVSLLFAFWRSFTENKNQRETTYKNINLIASKLDEINRNLINEKMDNDVLIKSRIDELENKVFELEKIIESQKIEIKKIKKK
jgi:hypothetical protein